MTGSGGRVRTGPNALKVPEVTSTSDRDLRRTSRRSARGSAGVAITVVVAIVAVGAYIYTTRLRPAPSLRAACEAYTDTYVANRERSEELSSLPQLGTLRAGGVLDDLDVAAMRDRIKQARTAYTTINEHLREIVVAAEKDVTARRSIEEQAQTFLAAVNDNERAYLEATGRLLDAVSTAELADAVAAYGSHEPTAELYAYPDLQAAIAKEPSCAGFLAVARGGEPADPRTGP